MNDRDFDIVIGGGGMVGAAVAALIVTDPRARGLKVALAEEQPASMPLSGEAAELRVSALSRASEQLLRAVGAWEALGARPPCPYTRMRVWDAAGAPDDGDALLFDAADIGEPDLGCIVENRAIAAALTGVALKRGVSLLAAPIKDLDLQLESAAVAIGERTLHTGLVVAADGSQSRLRLAAGIDVRRHAYSQRALVARLEAERAHGAEARQRFLPSGPLALLPLSDGAVSLVWSLPESDAERQLAADDHEFSQAVTAASGGVLGELKVASARAAFALSRDHAVSYAGTRIALVGDAAHTVHPLAGQGVNLGFLDAATLVETVLVAREAGEDPGDPAVLGRYSRARRLDNLTVAAAMDGLNKLFGARLPMVTTLRRVGLGLVNHASPVRTRLMREALGLSRELPPRLRPTRG